MPVSIGSKQVGMAVGQFDSSEKIAKVMAKWQKVWQGADVRQTQELLLPVAVDDRQPPRDWFLASVRSVVDGE